MNVPASVAQSSAILEDGARLVHIPAAVAQSAAARLGDFGVTLPRATAPPPPPGPPPCLTAPVEPRVVQQRELDAARHQQMIEIEARRQAGALNPASASHVAVTTVVAVVPAPPPPVETQLALDDGERWV